MATAESRTIEELIDTADPAWPLLKQWASAATNKVEFLARPSEEAGRRALLATQVTTRSPMGSVVFESGGLLVDHGWVRVLGAGDSRLPRSLPDWNRACDIDIRTSGMVLVADDVVGGFFALNGGAISDERMGEVFYLPPDTLEWAPTGRGYTEFIRFLFEGDLTLFYETYRWDGWETDIASAPGDRAFSIYPFPWAQGPPIPERSRRLVPLSELWNLHRDVLDQLGRA